MKKKYLFLPLIAATILNASYDLDDLELTAELTIQNSNDIDKVKTKINELEILLKKLNLVTFNTSSTLGTSRTGNRNNLGEIRAKDLKKIKKEYVKYFVTSYWLNLRIKPNYSSKILKTLNQGTQVIGIQNYKNEWIKTTNGLFINSKYLKKYEDNSFVVKSINSANIRTSTYSSPKTLIKSVDSSTPITIVGITKDKKWYLTSDSFFVYAKTVER